MPPLVAKLWFLASVRKQIPIQKRKSKEKQVNVKQVKVKSECKLMKVKYKSEKLCFISSLRKPLPNPVKKVKSKIETSYRLKVIVKSGKVGGKL